MYHRRRKREVLNVFIVFTDLLFVMVFILLLQVLAQGLATRSEAEASLKIQRDTVDKAICKLRQARTDWGKSICPPYQHESLQRITFTEAMTFKANSADINTLPNDDARSRMLFSDRESMLYSLAHDLTLSLPASSTVEIQGFWGVGDSGPDIAFRRARAVASIFQNAGLPGHRLVATAYSASLPRAYGYDLQDPARLEHDIYDRRVEILIVSRNTRTPTQ